MKITVKYNYPEDNVLEIQFLRGKILLHNIFYDVTELTEDEIFELKKEAIAKFGAIFPEISAKEIMKGFSAVDPLMQKLYKQTFETRGGARPNSGRKTGVKIKPPTVMFARRVTPEEHEYLEKCLQDFRNKNK